jgi:hypothetical protein
MDFRTTSLTDLAGSVRTRKMSARELTTIALDRIAALNPRYNAFVAVDPERALADIPDHSLASRWRSKTITTPWAFARRTAHPCWPMPRRPRSTAPSSPGSGPQGA